MADDILVEGREKIDEPKYGDPPDEAENLLTMDEKKAAEFLYRLWKDQPREPRNRRKAEWKVNQWRREGRTNVYVQKTQDKGQWTAWEPPWNSPPIPVLNKADRLCRRLVNIVFADPPVPEAVPSTGEDEDKEAAIQEVRILEDIQSEANLDDIRTARRAFDRASVYGSGFVRYYLDERGGGRQPLRIMAKPGAVSADAPFTGPAGEPLDGELVARYVREDGTLQDTADGAASRWMPALKREILQATGIAFLPHDAEDVWDADGLIIATMPTWLEIKNLWPDETASLSKDDLAAIFAFQPEGAKDIRGIDTASKREGTSDRDDDKRVAVFTIYHKSGPLYPDGCYVIGLADKLILHKQAWTYQPEDGGDPERLEIPVTQYSQFDPGWPTPFKIGLMGLLGNANELRASQVGHLLQYLDQFAGRRTFLPTNSIIQPKQYQLMAGAVIPMNPGGKPEFEDIPPFPAAPMDMFTVASEEMDDHSMLQQTAQGTDVPSITSGRQQAQVVQTAMASLSEIRQNIERAYIRGCRIQSQLIRVGYTVPQQISWTGEDGQYRQKWWSGSDLRGTADFKLKQGSLSMMTPEQKMNLAVQFQQLGVYNQNPDLFYDAITSSMGPVVGLEDDPSRSRIKRQLALWGEGPPEGWAPQPAAPLDPMGNAQLAGLPPPGPVGPLDQPAMALPPQLGGPQPPAAPPPAGPVAPPDPALASIFEVIPADEVQDVAVIRLSELKRFMASTRFTRWPKEWRAGVEQEFQHMKLCAGVVTVPEQMAQQQQAAQAQQEGQQQQQAQEQANKVQLEQLKAQLHAASGNGQKSGRVRILRDPTGRPAEFDFGPASPSPDN